MQAIILAGGKGTRLKPFTYTLPKPLMPIDDTPIIEIVIRQLKKHGFKHIIISINHLAEIIMAFLGDGKKLGVKIDYIRENKKLGTAGPMSLMKDMLDDDFLIMNGDLLTNVNYENILSYHLKKKSIATIGTYTRKVAIDFGVLEIQKGILKEYIEKPTYNYDVSMGINTFNKKVFNYLEYNKRLDIPELMVKMKNKGEKINCFNCNKFYWLDIGRVDDYEVANDVFRKKRKEFI